MEENKETNGNVTDEDLSDNRKDEDEHEQSEEVEEILTTRRQRRKIARINGIVLDNDNVE